MTNKARQKPCPACGSMLIEHPRNSEIEWANRKFCSYRCSSSQTKMSIEERFWEKVSIMGPGDCWVWNGAKDKYGYGKMGVGRRGQGSIKAHRISVQISAGIDLSPKDVVCHLCDNPSCVNPNHLVVADQSENMRQASERGRLNPASLKNLKGFNSRRMS